jgi:hypothetical protein
MSLRLCFVGAGPALTLVPTSIAELSVGELKRAGISYRPLEPPVHVDDDSAAEERPGRRRA